MKELLLCSPGKLIVIFALVLALTPCLKAGPIGSPIFYDGPILATGEEVKVFFLDFEAAYYSYFVLVKPYFSGLLMLNKTTPPGTSVSLGVFDPGTELLVGIYVANTLRTFLAGSPDNNVDGARHAVVQFWEADPLIPVSGILLGFEDIYGGGDEDFNDYRAVLSGVALALPEVSTPEPSTFWYVGLSLVAALLLIKRRLQLPS